MLRSDKCRVNSKGFTLIELMITIGIVAILVTLAIPAYQDYTIRSKISECINGAAVAKVSISEYRQTLGAWPPTMEEAGLTQIGNSDYCTAFNNYLKDSGEFTIDVDESAIDSGLAADSILPVMEPTIGGDNHVDWNCRKGATSPSGVKYLPATCRES